MNIAPANAISVAPTAPGWEVSFNFADGEDIVRPVIGWATVATSRDESGETTTSIEPAFVWLHKVWTETDVREHTPGALRFELRASADAISGAPAPGRRTFHRARGWTLTEPGAAEHCTSNHDRELAGVPACPNLAVWKVVELHDVGATISFWCDEDLPLSLNA
ncbi:hypothetical protein [Streptomyces microflavus]|uniref:hypothetical protein n=1 Tax=Streptomyces microflavus TaxID=1919 RepID=UPI00340DA67D